MRLPHTRIPRRPVGAARPIYPNIYPCVRGAVHYVHHHQTRRKLSRSDLEICATVCTTVCVVLLPRLVCTAVCDRTPEPEPGPELGGVRRAGVEATRSIPGHCGPAVRGGERIACNMHMFRSISGTCTGNMHMFRSQSLLPSSPKVLVVCVD